MSLSNILIDKQTTQFFRDKVKNPGLRPRPEVLVPPLASSPQRVGTAFDYALRFGLASSHNLEVGSVVAEKGLRSRLLTRDFEELQERYMEARESLGKLTQETLSEAGARACYFLASLDVVFRIKRTEQVYQEITEEEIRELQSLYEIIPWPSFQFQTRLALNPTFGDGSRLVGGADADLIVDDLLLDIKTTKSQNLSLAYVRQLVSYALLANRYGVDGDGEEDTIVQLGIYFSRAGYLHTFELYECVEGTHLSELLEYLCSYYR